MIKVKFNLKAVQGMTLEQFKSNFKHLEGVDLEKEYRQINPSKNKQELSPVKEQKEEKVERPTEDKKVR